MPRSRPALLASWHRRSARMRHVRTAGDSGDDSRTAQSIVRSTRLDRRSTNRDCKRILEDDPKTSRRCCNLRTVIAGWRSWNPQRNSSIEPEKSRPKAASCASATPSRSPTADRRWRRRWEVERILQREKFGEAYALKGRLLWERGKKPEALDAWEKAGGPSRRASTPGSLLARWDMQQQDWEGAAAKLRLGGGDAAGRPWRFAVRWRRPLPVGRFRGSRRSNSNGRWPLATTVEIAISILRRCINGPGIGRRPRTTSNADANSRPTIPSGKTSRNCSTPHRRDPAPRSPYRPLGVDLPSR